MDIPTGMTIHPETKALNGKPVRYVDLSAKLLHLVLMAAVAEETGKAAGSTTDHDGTATMVRLWASWAKGTGWPRSRVRQCTRPAATSVAAAVAS